MMTFRKKIPYIFLYSIIFLVSTSLALHSQTFIDKNFTDADNTDYIESNPDDTNLAQAPAVKKESVDTNPKDNPADADAGKKSTRVLKPLVIKGTREKKKKEIQTISRETLTAEEIKEVPGSFGDSVRALTSLPGIISAYGLFGPLVIRGADPISNNYFIDDIPINDPLHFGGLHSIINTNLIKDIDVYSSAFPAEFGSSTAAVINITTIDEVNEFGGYTNIGLLSADALIKTPILTDKFGQLILDTPSHSEREEGIENKGYFIASGRYGYIALGIKAAELITGNESPVSPEYWDYQVKSKYQIDSVNSITMLLFGHKDFIRVLIKESMLEEGDDPYFADAKFRYSIASHSQALYLNSNFSKDFSNKLLYYSSLPDLYYYLDLPAEGAPEALKDYHYHSKPWVFSLKDKANYKWMDGHSEFRGAAEYTFYYFTAKGKTLLTKGTGQDIDDLVAEPMDDTIKNHKIGGYLENKLTYSGLTVLPGVRSDYLARAETATFDPRLMTSYKFPTNTTISAAGGHYSYFVQTNPFIFNTNTDICALGKELKPEKAWHSSVGAEQGFDLLTLKIELFKNYFYDKPVSYPHTEPDGSYLPSLNSNKQKTHGFEIMLRKDLRENEDGLYGWMSYTYTRSQFKSGLPTGYYYKGVYQVDGNGIPYIGDPNGDRYMTSDFEQRHCVKLVSAYKFGNHTVSGKFQYYSGFPYTPITGYTEDMNYAATHTDPEMHRYIPVYGNRNSKNFPPYWQLDLRYTRKFPHSWGYISWYVEIINIFSSQEYEYKWYYNKEYSEGSNPKLREDKESLTFIPNFGVEVKF